MTDILGKNKCLLYGAGIEALYTAFKVVKEFSGKEEIVIPAYTADAVYIAAVKAGFRVKFCDMSLDSFNMNIDCLKDVVSKDTAAVVAVHLFGIPENMNKVTEITNRVSGFVIEDSAQALGSTYRGNPAGSMGDMSVISFNKGKNLPALTGGALLMDSEDMAAEAEKFYERTSLNFFKEVEMVLKAGAVSLLSRPLLYGLVYSLTSKFRKIPAKRKISPGPMPLVNQRLAFTLLKRRKNIFEVRRRKGNLLKQKLEKIADIRLPRFSSESKTVFNRFPVLIEDAKKRKVIKNRLMSEGIESNYYYDRPFYFDKEKIPKNAIYFSKHLLTLPSNEYMNKEKIKIVTKVFREVCGVST
ncbi:MAG: DegT/DnrJ/EryC1/StrS family aminotransferase [Elusimicrobiota bacterium]